MKRSILAVLAVTLFVVACGSEPRVIAVESDFDPQEVAWFNEQGTNTISGVVMIRPQEGEPRTCATFEVYLRPVSAYAVERAQGVYEATDSGFIPVGGRRVVFEDVEREAEYRSYVRTAACDDNGRFSFTNLPDGSYYIAAEVTWLTTVDYDSSRGPRNEWRGGYLLQRVDGVSGGEARSVGVTHSLDE